MQYYRCKCGKAEYMGSRMFPKDCEGCEECNTTYLQTTDGHKPLAPHKWIIRYDEKTGKPYKMCKDCYKKEKYEFPEKVCLCGSTRFLKTFDELNFKLALEGKIVLSIGCNTKSYKGLKLTADDKVRLDELHKRKIDLCDSVLVLNVGGYIGNSTLSEIEYAARIGKPVKYLEPLITKEKVGTGVRGRELWDSFPASN